MSTIKLDLLLVDTHSPMAISVADFSTYPDNYTPVSPTIQIRATGFPSVTLDFTPKQINVYTSENLGITCAGECIVPLPDGIYTLTYTINPAQQHFVEKSYLMVNNLMDRFDTAFMKLDMLECDGPIRKQRRVELDTIYYFIQGAIASANKCATQKAVEMYRRADTMLTQFITNKCNCNG
jgi:hypothetical protein